MEAFHLTIVILSFKKLWMMQYNTNLIQTFVFCIVKDLLELAEEPESCYQL